MNKLTATLCSALLLSSASAWADAPVNSTSTKQAAREQINNPGHMIDDCRVDKEKQSPQARQNCLDAQRLDQQNSKDQSIMEKTGQDDRVKHQDINAPHAQKADMESQSRHDDSLMESGNTRDKISQPQS